MPSVKVYESEKENIFRCIRARTGQRLVSDREYDLVVISPAMAEKHFSPQRECKILLLPGSMKSIPMKARCAVTYGLSGTDSITLSSLSLPTRIMALQREIMTVSGRILERQEVTVHDDMPPEKLLAVYGALLILGERL